MNKAVADIRQTSLADLEPLTIDLPSDEQLAAQVPHTDFLPVTGNDVSSPDLRMLIGPPAGTMGNV